MIRNSQHETRLRDVEAIVIGASAGAVSALSRILPPLPRQLILPILIVVHQPPDKSSSVAALFRSKCSMTVKEAEDKEPIVPGTVYFAPPDYHLLVEQSRALSLSNDEPVNFSRPSIDVLFESAADAFADRLVGIILTGASDDGAKGLQAICDRGGIGVIESPDLAEVSVMPTAAGKACTSAHRMSLDEIASYMQQLAAPEADDK